MSKKKKTTNYVRQPASIFSLQKKFALTVESNANLLELLSSHFPALRTNLTELHQQYTLGMSRIDALEGELTLSGHGPRASYRSMQIANEQENGNFLKLCKRPSEDPLHLQSLLEKLQTYLSFDQFDTGQHKRLWVMPDTAMFGRTLIDGTELTTENALGLMDGIYLIRPDTANDNVVVYTLKLTLTDGDVLLFSPINGPSLVSYSEVEQTYVQHTAWKFVSASRTLTEIDKFFHGTNVHDVSDLELQKVHKTLSSVTDPLPSHVIERDSQNGSKDSKDYEIPLSGLFTLHLPAVGACRIESVRDDIQWNDLSFYTRRLLFKNAVKDIMTLRKLPKGSLSTRKKALKKPPTSRGKK